MVWKFNTCLRLLFEIVSDKEWMTKNSLARSWNENITTTEMTSFFHILHILDWMVQMQ